MTVRRVLPVPLGQCMRRSWLALPFGLSFDTLEDPVEIFKVNQVFDKSHIFQHS